MASIFDVWMEHLGMWLRRVPARDVFKLHRKLADGGVNVSRNQLETQALAGGDIHAVANALLAAKAQGLPASWLDVSALDLAGMDVVALVNARAPLKDVLGRPGYERFRKIRTIPIETER